VLTILDAATGKPVRPSERLPGVRNFYASPIFAGGHVYFTDRDGVTVVLKPGPRLDVVSTNKLDDPVDASPVAVDNQLFLRGAKFLYCIEQNP
jgi:outer membrane protein assembly factor BamB